MALEIPFCQERGANSLDEFILFDWECTDYRDGWGGAVAWNELHLGQYVVAATAAAGHMSNELLPNLDKMPSPSSILGVVEKSRIFGHILKLIVSSCGRARPEIAQIKVTEVVMRHETSSLGLFRLKGLNNCAISEVRNFATLHVQRIDERCTAFAGHDDNAAFKTRPQKMRRVSLPLAPSISRRSQKVSGIAKKRLHVL